MSLNTATASYIYLFITPEQIDEAEATSQGVPFGPIGEIVDVRTYRRFIPDEERRETFWERNARTVNHNFSLELRHRQQQGLPINIAAMRQEAAIVFHKMNLLELASSGRNMWVGGTESNELHPASSFNCSATAINRLDAFEDILNLLCLGVGVGYRTFKRDVANLPAIINPDVEVEFYDYTPLPKQYRQDQTILATSNNTLRVDVGDSREGWAAALMAFLQAVTNPAYSHITRVVYDMDSVRPMGERIYGFGGTASGPDALKGIITTTARIVRQVPGGPGKRFRPIDASDIANAIARGVIAGSSRRSAEIDVFEQGDVESATAKVGLYTDPAMADKSYRSQSNNTEAWFRKPTWEELQRSMAAIRASAEPGIQNHELLVKRRKEAVLKWRGPVELERYLEVGVNPCFAPGSLVPVINQGLVPIEQLAKQGPVQVYDGNLQPVEVQFRQTGSEVECLPVQLSNGAIWEVTPYHNFVLADGRKVHAIDLQPGDELDAKMVTVFGTEDKVYEAMAHASLEDTPHKVPEFVLRGTEDTMRAYITERFLKHGEIASHDGAPLVRVKALDIVYLEQLQALLYNFGVVSHLTPQQHLLIINPERICSELITAGQEEVEHCLQVVGVLDIRFRSDVYCCTVPTTGSFAMPGFISGNCSEISLNVGYVPLDGGGFCNLVTQAVFRLAKQQPDGTYALDWALAEENTRLIARMNLRQTCVEIPMPGWNETQLEERLLGVSGTGWQNLFALMNWGIDHPDRVKFLRLVREWANDEATKFAAELEVPRPLMVTTIKPEGTWSLVTGCSSGLHWDWAPYYIRRVRVAARDAVAQTLLDQGYPCYPELYDLEQLGRLVEVPKDWAERNAWQRLEWFDNLEAVDKRALLNRCDTVVFEFPIASPTKVASSDVPALEQLETVRQFTHEYTDHLPSSTITVKDDEWEQVTQWVYDNWDSYLTASFFAYWGGSYPLLPNETIDQERYEAMLARIPAECKVTGPDGRLYFHLDQDLVTHYERLAKKAGEDLDATVLDGECSKGGCPVR